MNLDLAPGTPLDRLSPGERQLVEVATALQLDAEIIIFDEPTTSLTARETERLFALIGRLREAGKSMIYISHILADVMALADDIAVLRDGELIAAGPQADFTIARMITLMVGRADRAALSAAPVRSRSRACSSRPRRSRAAGVIKDVSFALHSGEVLGIFGLMGSGRTELARILFGLDGHDSGEIVVGDRRLGDHSPRAQHPERHRLRHREPARGGPPDERARSPRTSRSPRCRNSPSTPLEFIEQRAACAAAAAGAGGRARHQGGLARSSRPRACPAATSRRWCSPSG